MKKRILYYSPCFLPTNAAAAVRAESFVKALSQNYEIIKLSSTASSHSSQTETKLASNQASLLARLGSEIIVGIELFFKILFSSYSFVILSSPPFFAVLFAAWACRLSQNKYIVDVRDLYPQVFHYQKIISPTSFFYKLLLRLTNSIYRNSHLILTVTDGLVEEIQMQYPNKKTLLIRNGFDETLFKPDVPSDEKFRVIFHGNLGKFQNIELLIQIAQILHTEGFEFHVYGSGPKEKLLYDSKYIKFHGEISYKDTPKTLQQCHLGLSFRTDDDLSANAFPVKTYEFIGVGIPSIVTPISEAGRVLEQQGLGFQFSNNEIDKICETLRELKNNREFYQNIRRTVIEKRMQFSRSHQAQILMDHLNL